jgi:hypothetical protein
MSHVQGGKKLPTAFVSSVVSSGRYIFSHIPLAVEELTVGQRCIGEIPELGMPSLAVVKDLDVLGDLFADPATASHSVAVRTVQS